MRHYAITVLNPRPSMNVMKTVIHADTYHEAVEMARRFWRTTGRTTCLYSASESGVPGTYYWHRITPDGAFVDRNTNSGVPTSGQI